jgi:hypothetical protein
MIHLCLLCLGFASIKCSAGLSLLEAHRMAVSIEAIFLSCHSLTLESNVGRIRVNKKRKRTDNQPFEKGRREVFKVDTVQGKF